MPEITLNLSKEETAFVIAVMNQLPTQSNVWPLVQKIDAQFKSQLPQATAEAEQPAA